MNARLPTSESISLRVYLHGLVDFSAALAVQHALIDEVGREGRGSALLLCEHAPLITVGRHGGPGDIRCTPEELRARRLQVRWVNRAGGSLLHLPGQLAVYPVLPLDRLGLGVDAYVRQLQGVVLRLLDDFGVRGEVRDEPGVWVGGRLLAAVGVAVRDWVSYYGAVINIDPDLHACRLVRVNGEDGLTSLARERRGALRPALVRQRFLEHFADAFGFDTPAVIFGHPLLKRQRPVEVPG